MTSVISTTASHSKRRLLMPSEDSSYKNYKRRAGSCNRYKSAHGVEGDTESIECAKLVTTNAAGRREGELRGIAISLHQIEVI